MYLYIIVFAIDPQQGEKARLQERARVYDIDFQEIQRTNEQIVSQPQLLEQALEKEIDSTKYILGPGDKLLIKIWGPFENQFFVDVSPEGYIVIPASKEIKVSGLSLAEGIRLIKETLSKYFKEAKFSIRLIKLRKFRVYVVGEIQNPGTYYLRASDRLSDAIQLAGGLIEWSDEARIEIRHFNGSVDTVDINQFYLEGNLDANPHLNGGDIIYIPPINLEKNFVVIEGNVGSEGIYQVHSGETLFEFLTRTKAINRRAEINNILLYRNGEKYVYNLLSKSSKAKKEILQRGDRIFVPTNKRRVYVKGEVRQPGAFPYLASYTAADYAGLAGILETAKDMDEIYVIRNNTGKIEKGAKVMVFKGDIVVVPKRTREIIRDYLSILTSIISLAISTYALIRTTR